MNANVKGAHGANRLLLSTSASDFMMLRSSLELVSLELRAVLVDVGEPIRHVYFPHSAVICLMAVMGKDEIAETATVGPEGVVGIEVFLGKPTAMHRTLVQVPGAASRIGMRELSAALQQSGSLRTLMLRYIGAFLFQVTQSVACNSLHKLEERCARWLLMAHDRAHRDEFRLTQDFLADVLGVHRPTVTVAARTLQEAGLINYSRGRLTIANRQGLEESACDCYGVVKRAYDEIYA